ncbi:3'(2'),5'-bisphosphate nucleotidase CysQ [Candidatus Woesearchaeota archaeon]|nr:3'(2'),5'-bisphosphate nucleotidase CysQ [Candidatus Woesearchaeota archaeon]
MKIDINIIKEIALEAGKEVMKIYQKDFKVEYKNDASPLTEADLAANDIIVRALQANYPSIPILSEETKHAPYEERKSWDKFWLVDPIDGTKGFVMKNGEFTINIALIENGTPTVGAVYIPVSKILYYSDGESSFKQIGEAEPFKITVREIPKDKITVVGSKNHMNKETEDFVSKLSQEFGEAEFVSTGSSIKLCWVADGTADFYPRLGPTCEWDTGAAHAVVKGAGGKVLQFGTDKELVYNKENLLNPFFIVQK